MSHHKVDFLGGQKKQILLFWSALKNSLFIIFSQQILSGVTDKEAWLPRGAKRTFKLFIQARSFNQPRDWRAHLTLFIPLTQQVKDAY